MRFETETREGREVRKTRRSADSDQARRSPEDCCEPRTAIRRRSALIYEADGLVVERLRPMLRAEGYACCAADDFELFLRLEQSASFDLFVAGVPPGDPRVLFRALGCMKPLLLLVSNEVGGIERSARLALPEARVVDRALRNVDAVRLALSDEIPADPVHDWTPRETIRRAFEPFDLSRRQLEVLECALLGDTSTEIAGKLYISQLTVRNHLHAIYERVGVRGHRELLGRFVQSLIEGNA